MTSYRIAAQELRPNPAQWQAYESEGHLVVLAGPGSGKTKLLTTKLARILSEDIRAPQRVACLTYSNECVAELRKRLVQLEVRQDERLFLGTVHSFCFSEIIRPFARLTIKGLPVPIRIAPEDIQEQLLQEAIDRFGRDQQVSWFRPDIDRYRRTFLDRDRPEWRSTDQELASIIEEYERLLRAKGLVDFDDMVLFASQILASHLDVRRIVAAKYPVLVVDEYQDLGLPLHRIVELLCFQSGVRLVAVGDPDQSIYGFAGARPETLLTLSKRPGVVPIQLKHNYRSGQRIIKAAEAALGEARGFVGVRQNAGFLDVKQYQGGPVEQCEKAIGEILPGLRKFHAGLALGDIAVLYPSKTEGNYLAEACRTAGVHFVRNDRGAPYRRTRIVRWLENAAMWAVGRTARLIRWNDLLDQWEALWMRKEQWDGKALNLLRQRVGRILWHARDPQQALSSWLVQFIDEFKTELSQMESDEPDEVTSLGALYQLSCEGALKTYNLTMFAFAGGSPDTLNLVTLHSSKGLEFDAVIMVGLDEGVLPRWNASKEGIAEARRLFYVGLTRAKLHVVMVYSGFTVNRHGRKHHNGPSRFVSELMSQNIVK